MTLRWPQRKPADDDDLRDGARVVPRLVLVHARPLMPEVRRVYMGESLIAFTAMAMLVRASPLGRTMGNVYLKIARPAIPTKLFTQESKALAWLRAAK